MKILLVFDNKFPIDNIVGLVEFIQNKSKFIKFDLHKDAFSISTELITKPKTFNETIKKLKKKVEKYDKVFCFTQKQYEDNFFFHTLDNVAIFSFFAWNYLTDLPFSNGVLHFIIDYLALEIDESDFRHFETTGCIYDFHEDKQGIDGGMRQSRFCSNCLTRISNSLTSERDFKIFDDLQILMDHLSNSSRWNKDILTPPVSKSNTIERRKPKRNESVSVVIASPGDTEIERRLLLDTLEVRFRRENHESHCGFRIIVSGWEDLASQPGYAQDVINEKLISETDFVVAIFKHKLGTPTKEIDTGRKRAESGTAEELLQALEKSKGDHPIGMAYFFSQAPLVSLDNPDKHNIEKEWARLSDFKNVIKDKMIYKPYTDGKELVSIILKDLENNITQYLIK